jgi:V8-like Glu-specific endopeptidase
MTAISDFDIIEAPVVLMEAEAAAVEAYWTTERISEAVPLPLPELVGAPPLVEPPGALAGGPVLQDEVPPAAEGAALLAVPSYVTSRVSNLSVSPYMYVGKLYMTFGPKNFVGSAWCICKSSIFSAGHCVYDHETKSWATNVLFKGRYDGVGAAGSWAVRRLVAPRGWTEKQDWAFDLGAGIASGNIQSVIGSAGWLANAAPNQGQIDAIGYPASPIPGYNFDGEHMWHCVGRYEDGNTILRMGNNMTGGCSGGPWSVTYNGQHRMNGVNSHRYNSDPHSMYSPHFGSAFLKLVDWLRQNGGC